MKKLVWLIILFWPLILLGQETDQAPTPLVEPAQINPFIKAEVGDNRVVEVNQKVVLDAKTSIVEPNNLEVDYLWDFGDGSQAQGIEVSHIYEDSGEYLANLKIQSKTSDLASTDTFKISVFNDLIIFLTDREDSDQEFSRLKNRARRQGVAIKAIPLAEDNNEFVSANQLAVDLNNNQADLNQAGIIIAWTNNNLALSVLAKLNQVATKENFNFKNKIIAVVTGEDFSQVSAQAQTVFNSLKPASVILIQEEGISTVIDARKADKLISLIQTTSTKHLILGVHSRRLNGGVNLFNFTSYLVNFMLNRGVPLESILLTLMLPIVVTIIALARQIIGMKTFGIYTPTIVALSLMGTGLKYGLAIFLLILITGTLARLVLRKVKLLHIPKIAIVLTVVSLAILAMLAEGSMSSRTGLISVSLFPMLIMITLVEKFINVQVEKGTKAAIMLSAETLLLSIACYYLATWQSLRMLILSFPEIIFLTVIINLLLGKWAGLTIVEYLRFRDVLKQIILSKKNSRV